MEDDDCKCTKGQLMHYVWAGVEIDKEDGETWPRAIAKWFALKAANDELRNGNLDTHRFNQFTKRLAAYVEQKIDRVIEGKLLPGTDVECAELAKKEGIPIFELKWHREERILKLKKKELIRQYEGEPFENIFAAFGLHMHLKSTQGTDREIHDAQDSEILIAIKMYRYHEDTGWPEYD